MQNQTISLEGNAVHFPNGRPLSLGLVRKMHEEMCGKPLPAEPAPEEIQVVLHHYGLCSDQDNVVIFV